MNWSNNVLCDNIKYTSIYSTSQQRVVPSAWDHSCWRDDPSYLQGRYHVRSIHYPMRWAQANFLTKWILWMRRWHHHKVNHSSVHFPLGVDKLPRKRNIPKSFTSVPRSYSEANPSRHGIKCLKWVVLFFPIKIIHLSFHCINIHNLETWPQTFNKNGKWRLLNNVKWVVMLNDQLCQVWSTAVVPW